MKLSSQYHTSSKRIRAYWAGFVFLQFVNHFALLPVTAKEIQATGEFMFGPQLSKEFACNAAAKRAIDAAIRQVNGEAVSTEGQYICRENSGAQGENYQCVLNQSTWSQIDGDVKNIIIQKEVITELQGASQCTVSVIADVVTPASRPDANFNFSFEVNQRAFKDGEKIRFVIKTSTNMHLAIFSYLPYLEGNHQVTRIFPNIYEKESKVAEKIVIPGPNSQYELLINWLDNGSKEKVMQDEHFMIIATKEPIKWLDDYSIDKFKSVLREIPADKIRKAQGSYIVLKEKSNSKN